MSSTQKVNAEYYRLFCGMPYLTLEGTFEKDATKSTTKDVAAFVKEAADGLMLMVDTLSTADLTRPEEMDGNNIVVTLPQLDTNGNQVKVTVNKLSHNENYAQAAPSLYGTTTLLDLFEDGCDPSKPMVTAICKYLKKHKFMSKVYRTCSVECELARIIATGVNGPVEFTCYLDVWIKLVTEGEEDYDSFSYSLQAEFFPASAAADAAAVGSKRKRRTI